MIILFQLQIIFLLLTQDLVAFAGVDDMASEVFSVQFPLSPTPLYSNLTGTLEDHGITGASTLYVLWLSLDEVQVRKCDTCLFILGDLYKLLLSVHHHYYFLY